MGSAMAVRTVPQGAPRLQYGDAWIEDYLPDSVLRDGRLVPLTLPEGAPEQRLHQLTPRWFARAFGPHHVEQ